MDKNTENLVNVFIDENYDACTECGHSYRDDEEHFIGYGENRDLKSSCKACSSNIKEVLLKREFYRRPYKVPRHDAVLWRYMDFSKYVSLLSTSSLYFARSDTFEDHFEGAQGIKSNREQWDRHHLDYLERAITYPPDGGKTALANEEIKSESQRLLKQIQYIGESGRERTYINCWHENEHESEAMWRLYSSYINNAVAIKTTYKRLSSSLEDRTNIQIGTVEYLDFRKQFSGINSAFWRKRKSFQHEREVRAIYFELHNKDIGISIHCNLSTLIEAVYISPKAPEWFKRVVDDVNIKYGLNITVSKSELNEEPFY